MARNFRTLERARGEGQTQKWTIANVAFYGLPQLPGCAGLGTHRTLAAYRLILSMLLLLFRCCLDTLSRLARCGLVFLVMVLTTGTASAKTAVQSGAVVQYPELRAELVAYAPQGIGADQALSLGLLLNHQAGWHTYWVNPGDSGLPTEMHWTLPAGAQVGTIAWPVPQKIRIGALANLGYEGQVLLPVKVQLQPGFRLQGNTFDVQMHASWLVCRQECIPQEGDFTLRIPAQGATALHGALFEAAEQKRPAPFGGQVQAELIAQGLVLRAKGLPQAWQGKAIAVFPETPAIFATPALPDLQDQIGSAWPSPKDAVPAQPQSWDADSWTGLLRFSPQRVSGPDSLRFVLSAEGTALQVTLAVPGKWPAVAPAATDTGAVPGLPPNASSDVSLKPSALALWGALAAAFVGGLLLNLMPCVFPVLALKALGLATLQSKPTQRRAQAVAYAGGVLVSMAALGALLLGLRAGGQALGWGFHLQSPLFIAALATLFTLICMNLMDMFDMSKLVPGQLAGLQLRNPVSDAALSGVLAVLVASPCTAPFMGASLGLAMTLPGWQAMLIFIALGLGLSLPYAMVSNSEALARRLPKPGAWMEQLRQFMVFPMAATVLWLVWVLAHMAGIDSAALLVAMLLCLCMCLWALRLPGQAARGFGVVALLATLLSASLAWQMAAQADSPANSAEAHLASSPWRNWTAQAEREALASGHSVFVDFTAAWCITCQYNKQNVLNTPRVLQAFADKQVVLMRADWTRRDAAISEALQQLGRSGVPVYVLWRPGQPARVLYEILSSDALLAELAAL